MIRIGLLGYGHWGPELARNVVATRGCALALVSDPSPKRLGEARRALPHIEVTTSWQQLVADPSIDAIVIATPVSTHFELALAALTAGKHVLVEKPLTQSVEQAERLIEASERSGLVLMVDHTYLFSPAVRKIRELVRGDGLGEPWYYDSVRVNVGVSRGDVNVIWDLAAHDLSILDAVLSVSPCAVQACGWTSEAGGPERLGYLLIHFTGGFVAHINVSWVAPVKIRRTMIGGSRRMIVFDDLLPAEKLKVYDRGGEPGQTGTAWSPELETIEPLRAVVEHFAECISAKRLPQTDGAAGLRVVRLLEASSRSLEEGGRLIELEPTGVSP